MERCGSTSSGVRSLRPRGAMALVPKKSGGGEKNKRWEDVEAFVPEMIIRQLVYRAHQVRRTDAVRL